MGMDFSPAHVEMLRLHTQIAGSIHELVSVPLPTDIDADFRRLYDVLTPQTPLESSAQRTFQRIDDIRQGLIAAIYHQRNVATLERTILQVCREAYQGGPPVSKPTTMAFGADRLTCEYHAFLFAMRRAFEYLNNALVAYFERESGSFRKLPRALNGAAPAEVAAVLAKKVEKALGDFEDVLGRTDARAPRDRVAHRQPERPAEINMEFKPNGEVALMMVGGAEQLPLIVPTGDSKPRLGDILEQRVRRFERLVFELLRELPDFRDAVAAVLRD
jgi:hypothetical protein